MKLIILLIGTLAAILLSLFFGAANLSVSQTLKALLGNGREIDVTIIRELRLPRTFLGAVIGAVLQIAGPRKGASTLILAGVGVGALATALTGLIMNFAPNPWALSEIVYWLMGSLKNAEMGGLMICAPLTVLGIALLFLIGPDLRTLSLGEETATSLGVSLTKVRTLLIAGTALCGLC